MTEQNNNLKIGAARVSVRTGLTAYDRQFVPTLDEDYQLDEAFMEALAVCVDSDLNALLVGPTGCGKSTGIELLAAILNQPVRRVNLHGDFRASDLLGEKILDPDPDTGSDRVVWRDGILPDAMRRGHWIILDEFDACPASIAMTVQAVLEPGHPLTLAANHGESVQAHPSFRVFATGNTLGRGDESGLYAGTNMLNEATLDRFVCVQCDYPGQELEVEILKEKTGIDGETAAKMIEVATYIRKALEEGVCYATFSTRRLIAWASLSMKFGFDPNTPTGKLALVKGYRFSTGNKLSPEDAEYFAGCVQRVMGVNV